MRPWYSRLASVSGYNLLGSVFLVFVVGYAVVGTFGLIPKAPTTAVQPARDGAADARELLYLVGFGFVLFLFTHGRRLLFPLATFAIGRGRQRQELREWARRAFVTLLASTVVGFALKLW